MSDFGKRGRAGDRPDYTREAMLRRRASRWRGFASSVPAGWGADAIWAAGVWAHCPVTLIYLGVCGRGALCGGGGDEGNLDDDAPAGLYPQARACAQAADAIPQPGQVEVLAAVLGGLQPREVLAYAQAAHAGQPTGTNLTTGALLDRPRNRSLERLLGGQGASEARHGHENHKPTQNTYHHQQAHRSEL